MIGLERDGGVERVSPAGEGLPRDVVEQVDEPTGRRRRASPTAAATSAGGGAGRVAGSWPGRGLWAPTDIRVTPAVVERPGVAAVVGPGFASSVTSAPSARPSGHRRGRSASDRRGRRSEGVPPPKVHAPSSGRRGPAAEGRSRRRPELQLGLQRRDERIDPGRRTARPPRHRRRSRSTGRPRRRTGRGRTARGGGSAPGDRRGQATVDGVASGGSTRGTPLAATGPRVDDAPAVRRPTTLLDLLVLGAADAVWPAWPVARKNAKRVMACPRKAAPMPPVRPSANRPPRPIPTRQDEHSAATGRAQPRREAVQERLDGDGQLGTSPVLMSKPKTRPGRRPRR